MNLIDRYVQAVKTYLPAKKREDVGEELLSLLHEKLDDMRMENNGQLSEQDEVDFLKRQGHPMTVAARYQEQQVLVSETLYPLYRQFIKWTLLILVSIKVFYFALGMVEGWEGLSLKDFIGDTFESILLAWASLTLLFHFGGRFLEKRHLLEYWNPRALPALRTDWQCMPRSDSIPSLFGNLILLGFINGLAPFHAEHISIVASAEFAALLPWANGILLFSLAYDVDKIFRPLHTRMTTIFILVLSIATQILLGYVLFMEYSVELRLGDKIFHPLKSHLILIAMFTIFLVETWPNARRLLRMI